MVTPGRKRNLPVFQMTSPVNRFDITGFFTYIYTRLETNFPFSAWTGFYDGRRRDEKSFQQFLKGADA